MEPQSQPSALPRVTLKDVAREAGVHVSTAWRALSNETYVSAEKRQRIRAIADRLGYTPDPMLSALSSYRRKQRPPAYRSTLAWINNFPVRGDCLALPHIAGFFEGARTYAESMGFRLEEFWLRERGMTPKRAREVLLARNIRGLLFAPQALANTQLALDLSSFACVSIGYSLAEPRLHVAVNDQHASTLLCLRRLLQLGHRRIGMASASDTLKRTVHHFESPFHVFQNALLTTQRVPLFLIEGRDEPANKAQWQERFGKWFRTHRPEAIITTFSETIPWLNELGLKVPDDVSVATLSRMQQPGWAGIDQQERIIGARAVELLISIFQAGERGVPDTPLRMLVEGKWYDGVTVRSVGAPVSELLGALE
ncbi:MAG: LacI family DNA-binding transcriptional regulator [Opitutae bacterium]|nr:LacI family DNA-binding transcriptional regulator [Opitutae bacterium]